MKNNEVADTLFEVSNELLRLVSLARQNPVLSEALDEQKLDALQERVNSQWRELMKTP